MEKVLYGIIAIMGGAVLGGIYYGGLWWTVSRLTVSRRPALLSIGSLMIRMGIVVCGFLFISRGDLLLLALCLVGLFLARLIAIRHLGPGRRTISQMKGET